LTDRLSLTNALAEANIDRTKAERIATEIYDAIHDNVATKSDLHELEQRLELRFAQIELRFTQIERQIDRMVARLGGRAVVLLGLLFGALHLWPPHG
jgi:predicted  nucleic acid-binding Zn-ribbon protein